MTQQPGPQGEDPSYQQPYGQAPAYRQQPGTELSPSDQRMWAMFAHLSGLAWLLGGWAIVPALVIFLVFKDRGIYVREQAAEALNFQITVLLAMIVSGILVLILVGFLLLIVVGIAAIVFAIIAGVAANKGENYRYPFNIRLVS